MAKRKKQISQTEKKLRGKVKYLKSKNRKILKEVEKLNTKDENKFIKFEGKKRKVSTVKNILKNKITKNNTAYSKSINQLEKRFNYKVRSIKPKTPSKRKGVFKSPNFSAWQTKDAKQWVESKNKSGVLNEVLIHIFESIDATTLLMGSDNLFYITIDFNTNDFEVNLSE